MANVFIAPSGTGKSTHARLWREVFGERVWMINDDKPVLRIDGGELSAEEEAMLDYICASGAHGTLEHAVDAQLRTGERSRVGYLLGRLFPPWRRAQAHYAAYAAAYPWFYRHRLLLPFYRLWRAAKSGRLRAELRALRSARRRDKSNQGPG